MKLLQAIKPHRTALKLLRLDKRHKVLATLSQDNCIYIFRAKNIKGIFQMEPIGYFQMENSVVTIVFKKNKYKITLLIAMENKDVVLTDLTDLPNTTSASLRMSLEEFPCNTIKVPEIFELSRNIKLIDAIFKFDESDDIRLLFSNEMKTFLADIKLSDGGQATADVSELPSPPKQSNISVIRYWLSGRFLFLGYQNGTFRMTDIQDLSNMSSWTQGLNDPSTGVVTDIMQYKEFVVTSGGDGTIFTQRLSANLLHLLTEASLSSEGSEDEYEWKKLSGKVGFKAKEINHSSYDNVHDIEDPNHLCLEDMKLREAEEKTNKEMEDKMLKIQKDVSNLKRDFRKIQTRNEALNREYQVPKEKFQMTDFTYKIIQEEIENKLKEVVKSRESETQESKNVLENIRKRFFDPIKFNRIVVKGLKSKQELTTFRISHMKIKGSATTDSTATQESVGVVKAETLESWSTTPKPADVLEEDEVAAGRLGKDTFGKQSTELSSTIGSVSRQKAEVKIMNEQVAKALAKQEAKRERKLARKKEWDELHYRKPKEGEEDPTLIEEINQARMNMGDFKRKTHTDYVNHKTIKPSEKAKVINDVLNEIHQQKCELNEKVIIIKKEKKNVLEKLEDLTKKLVDIQYLLEPGKRKTVPTIPALDIDEHIVDPFEIDPKLVETIKAKLFQEAEDMLAEKRSGTGSRRSSLASRSSRRSKRMSRQLSASSRQSSVTGIQVSSKKSEKKPKHTEGLFASLGPGQPGTVAEDELEETTGIVVEKSVYEANIDGMKSMEAEHNQDIKIAEMEDMMEDFDNKIFDLVCEKDKIETRLKFAEISATIFYEEYQIVNQDQDLEANHKANVAKQEASLNKLNAKLADVERQLIVKQKNVENLKEQKKSIQEMVERELSDNKHAEYLWRLYNKKPTSTQKQEAYEKFTLDVESSSCILHQSAGCTNDDDNIKGRPTDLNYETFKLIADFREKRFAIEATLMGENRMEENISRELSNLKRNHAQQTESLNKARNDLQSFKYSKQCKLNNLDAVLIVTKEEMKSLENERLAGQTDASDPLLAFPGHILTRLHNRTEELKTEKNATKSKYKEARNVFENLQLDCKNLKKDIQSLDVKCGVEMQKRFGTGVTLETLEGFAVNRTLEEMKESSRLAEKHYWKIQNKREQDTRDIKYELHKKVLRNTELVKRRTKSILDREANRVNKQKALTLMEKNRRKANSDEEDQKELKEMIEIFQTQGEEIMELKSVLVRYVMKGIPVDPVTGKKNLRDRPSISEITRPRSSRIRLKSSRPQTVTLEYLEKID